MRPSGKPALYGDAARWGLIEADALLLLVKLPDACADAIVTDPPYGIDFAGQGWDGRDIRRVASRRGEHLNAAEAFERWTNLWAAQCRRVLKPGGHLLAFGAPRTFHRLTCGIEDAELEIRDVLLWCYGTGMPKSRRMPGGLGTALKPAYEPILLARAPITSTVTANVKVWGAGALNIEASRVGAASYWPANVVLSHDPGCDERGCIESCAVRQLDESGSPIKPSRLLYCAKASRRERESGCETLALRQAGLYKGRPPRIVRNIHPTVKPLSLMRHLVKLVVPPTGLVLDPFTGSGSTGAAALLEGRQFLGIEREASYVEVACARLAHWANQAPRRVR